MYAKAALIVAELPGRHACSRGPARCGLPRTARARRAGMSALLSWRERPPALQASFTAEAISTVVTGRGRKLCSAVTASHRKLQLNLIEIRRRAERRHHRATCRPVFSLPFSPRPDACGLRSACGCCLQRWRSGCLHLQLHLHCASWPPGTAGWWTAKGTRSCSAAPAATLTSRRPRCPMRRSACLQAWAGIS